MGLFHSPSIVTDELVFLIDFKNVKSYSNGDSTIYDLIDSSISANDSSITSFSSSDGVEFTGPADSSVTPMSFSSTINVGSSGNGFFVNLILKLPSTQTSTGWNKLINDFSGTGGLEIGVYNINNTRFIFKDTSEGGVDNAVDTGTLMNADQWHHIAFGQTSDAYGKMYLDGKLVDTSANTWNTSTVLNFSVLGTGNNTQHFKGNVLYAVGYNKELSESEVVQNYQALRGRLGV